MNRIHWTILWVASACAMPVTSTSPPPAAQPPQSPPSPPPQAPQHDAKAEAARILRAYADSHTFGEDRRAPTPAEVAAAATADPIDLEIAPERWRSMDTGFRLLEVYLQTQHRLWWVACDASVAQWWQSARQIDDELQARLAQPAPADFYAGVEFWRVHWEWLDARRQNDAAFGALPGLAAVGASFRLVNAQNSWSATWLAQDRPLEHQLSQHQVYANAWAIEDLPTEQARFCKAAFAHDSGSLNPPTYIEMLKPGGPLIEKPPMESGYVARINKHGTEWVVTRRDWTQIIEEVPPCKRVRCTQIDCAMDPRGGWRDICAQKVIRRFHDNTWVLHFDAPPTKPRLGDFAAFYLDPTTGHAVLTAASRRADAPPYFFVYLL